MTQINRYGFWHGNSPNTNPQACWEKYSSGRFQEIFRILKEGKVQMTHPSLPLPLEGIPFDSAEMGKHYSRFCLPGEHTSTEIFSIGKSLDPSDLCLPDPDEDWFAYESAFYEQAASCEPVAD